MNENSSSTPTPTTSSRIFRARRARRADAYNHYPTGWAIAFSTPFRMFKRYTYQGGVARPVGDRWPKGIGPQGEVRNQYHHGIDIVPTILDGCGVEMPDMYKG